MGIGIAMGYRYGVSVRGIGIGVRRFVKLTAKAKAMAKGRAAEDLHSAPLTKAS